MQLHKLYKLLVVLFGNITKVSPLTVATEFENLPYQGHRGPSFCLYLVLRGLHLILFQIQID